METGRKAGISDFLLDLIYPARCPACGRVVGWNEYFCDECSGGLEYVEDVPWQAVFPAQIGGKEPDFDCAESLFRYEGTARQAVLSFKYRSSRGLADYAADRIAEKLSADGFDRPDIVTSVPMNLFKRLDRGYDQAELFARAVSRVTGSQLDTRILGHRRRKRSQHDLSGKERLTAVESTYYFRRPYRPEEKPLAGKTVLLCDDIFTTGATANKCAGLLKELGADKVCVAVICRTMERRKSRNDEAQTSL